ncbi:MAG: NAD(P)-dependent oxidoreductase [Chloroflexota bacterium]
MPTKPKVIVDPHYRGVDEIFSDDDLNRLNDMAEVIWAKNEPMPIEAVAEALPEAEAIICARWRYGELLYQANHLRAILTVSGSFPLEFDYDYCYENRIHVLTCAPAFARQVAEMALGMALAAGREIVVGDRAMRANEERYSKDGNIGTFMLYDQPVGFIGYGSLARSLHPLLKPFNCEISVYDPWLGNGYLQRQGVTPVNLETLMNQSQVIFVLATPTVENRALLSRELLKTIRPGAALILVSRAHVVDFDALTELVLAGRFKAAIDVFPREPLEADHPIRQAPNAILSAHRAGTVKEGLWEIGEMVLDDLEVILQGLPPRRMNQAVPELSGRYATPRVPSADNKMS